MQIFVATITHKHGTNVYTSETSEGIHKQIADYCREWWEETVMGKIPSDDSKITDVYFAYHAEEYDTDEYYEVETVTLGN